MGRKKLNKKCAVDGCERKHHAKGYCNMHYTRFCKHGDPEYRLPTLEERFHASYTAVPESGCWLWMGCCDKYGYGQISVKRKAKAAHRVSWELHNGPIPKRLLVCHKCDVQSCVNPEHLFLGTQKDNIRDCISKGRFKGGNKNG